jgi:type IV fimbrial biogenesis protein FimT
MSRDVRLSDGFTLVELMIAVVVAAILLTTALPSFQETIKDNRMAANVNEFMAALNLARSEAIKRGTFATVCEGTAAGCSNTGNWEGGWIVFSDVDGDGVVEPGTDNCLPTEDCILRMYPALTAGYTLRGNNNVNNRVRYNAKGMSAGFNGTLVMCDDRGIGEDARAIVIARTGRARSMKATDTDEESCTI